MKVKELIKLLETMDKEKDVIFRVFTDDDWFYVSPKEHNYIISDDKVEVIETF